MVSNIPAGLKRTGKMVKGGAVVAVNPSLKAAFDKMLAAPKEPGRISDENSIGETAAKSFAKGASFGLLDEATAATLTPFLNEDGQSYMQTYRTLRDDARQIVKESEQDNPNTALASELTGGIASGVLLPGGAVSSFGGAMKVGAGYGALSGFGYSDADALENPMQLALDTAIGTGLGAAGGAAGYGLGREIASGRPMQLLTDDAGAMSLRAPSMRTASTIPKMSAAERTVYEKLVGEQGLTPDEAAQYVLQAGKGDVPLSLPELTGSKSLLQTEKLLRQNAGMAGEIEGAFVQGRNAAIPGAFEDFLGEVGTVRGPQTAGRNAGEAAKKVVSKAEAKRAAAAKPFYDAAYKTNLTDDAAKTIESNPIVSAALKKVDADPVYASALEGASPTSLQRFDLAKRALDDQIEVAKRAGESNRVRLLTQAKDDLLNTLDNASPLYKEARITYKKGSPRVERVRAALAPLVDGDPATAAKELFKGTERDVKYARRLLQTSDPDAWDSLVASHMSQIGDDVNHSPLKMLNAMTGKGSNSNLSRAKKFDAALSPKQRQAKQRFFEQMEKASRIRMGSDTNMNAKASAMLEDDLLGPVEQAGLSIARGEVSKQRLIQKAISWTENRVMGKRYAEMARIFTGEGADEFAEKILQTKPGSIQQWQLMNERIAKTGAVGATRGVGATGATEKGKTPQPGAAGVAGQGTAPARIPAGLKRIGKGAALATGAGGTALAASEASGNAPLPADIAAHEGNVLTAYNDTQGYRTVGRGFNMDSGIAKRVWKAAGVQTSYDDVYNGTAGLTQPEADALAAQSFKIAAEDALSLYKDLPDYSPSRKSALLNLSYQMGKPTLSEFTAFNGAVRAGKWTDAARYLLKSDYAKQTPQRARDVARMLLRSS